MVKEIITEEMGVHKDWYKQAKEMRPEDLPNFINRLLDDYEHDYGTICHALTAGAIATLYAMNNYEQGGITGFQAGCIMWEFIKNWNYTDNKTSLKITDFDKMLYPQYANSFEKTLSSTTWEALRKEAEVLLEENKDASPIVIQHWKSIIDGNIPFGYKLESEGV
jgi:hypothetical protein